MQVKFVSKIFGNQPDTKGQRLLALTATMPTTYLPLLSTVLTIYSFYADSLIRGTLEEFLQRKIDIQTIIIGNKGQYGAKGVPYVAKFLEKHPSDSNIIFCNSCQQSQHFHDHLEHKLNKLKLNLDVTLINGSLYKIDKFWRICLFCYDTHIRDFDFCVLITTNAAKVGLDKASISLQLRFDLPRDLLTYFQERGRVRATREPSQHAFCMLICLCMSSLCLSW
jgi:superfamily II DNA/RNA helicase